MMRLFVIIFLTFLSFSLKGQDKNKVQFLNQLLLWNIDYIKLDVFKAGAACTPMIEGSFLALGLSFQLADMDYAKKIALEGCNQMKEKKKILSECECEVIFINNNFLEKE